MRANNRRKTDGPLGPDEFGREQYVLGSMLSDDRLSTAALRRLSSLCFQVPEHKLIIKAMRDVRNKGKHISVAEVMRHVSEMTAHQFPMGYIAAMADQFDGDDGLFYSSVGWLEAQGTLSLGE